MHATCRLIRLIVILIMLVRSTNNEAPHYGIFSSVFLLICFHFSYGVIQFISATLILPTDLNFHPSHGFQGSEKEANECARNVMLCVHFLTCFLMEWCRICFRASVFVCLKVQECIVQEF
jgi:hypothetical protein